MVFGDIGLCTLRIAVAGLEPLSAEAKHIAMVHRMGAPYTELIYLSKDFPLYL